MDSESKFVSLILFANILSLFGHKCAGLYSLILSLLRIQNFNYNLSPLHCTLTPLFLPRNMLLEPTIPVEHECGNQRFCTHSRAISKTLTRLLYYSNTLTKAPGRVIFKSWKVSHNGTHDFVSNCIVVVVELGFSIDRFLTRKEKLRKK